MQTVALDTYMLVQHCTYRTSTYHNGSEFIILDCTKFS